MRRGRKGIELGMVRHLLKNIYDASEGKCILNFIDRINVLNG